MEPLYEQSDETLCGRAAAGDSAAEECLVLRYARLVRACARLYFLAGGDSEDLIQEGMIGLISAVREFSHEKECSFRSYAEVCIHNRLRSAVRAAAREKHKALNQSTPLFDKEPETCPYDTEHPLENDPEDLLIDREERKNRMEALQSKLSSFEKTVLELYLSGLAYREIAGQVEKPLKSVDNAVQRIRRKVAPFLNSGDFSVS